MELREITIIHYQAQLREEFETSFGKTRVRDTVLVKITDETGLEGWGESPVDNGPWYNPETVFTATHVIRDYIVLLLSKHKNIENPQEFPKITRLIRGHNMAKAGVEFALWDLYSKTLRQPLYKVIGGTRDRVEAGLSIGIIGDMDRLLKAVGKGLEHGYRRIKIKIKPGWDIEPVREIMKTYGNISLQVDANAAYTLRDKNVFKKLDKYNLLMIEQPLHHDDLYYHSLLQKELSTPICLDESIKSIFDVEAGYALGSYRIINIKPARISGLNETLKIHEFAKEHSIPLWIGGLLETGIGRAFQVASATLPTIKYPNDISESHRFYHEDIVEPPWRLNSDGTYDVPTKPGIGVEVKIDTIIRHSKKIITIKL